MHFVFDLDGTICFKGKPLSTKMVDCLLELIKSGNEVIFASARPIRDMLPVLDKRFHECTLIGGNGSLIYCRGKLICSTPFNNNELDEILSLIGKYNGTYLIDSDWDYSYTGPQNHPIKNNLDPGQLAQSKSITELQTIVKVLILTSFDFKELSRELKSLDVVVNEHKKENVLDISPKNINKWSALSSLGVKEQEFIVFGNDSNDIPMFEKAKYSVMVGRHDKLSILATDSISLEGDYEGKLVTKIRKLSNIYNTTKV
ncbi:HAD-IIB family hydrolase [Rossellomorea aquimaris]|uniref:HAD-IIB family hydrolase n=1 Tax=Rossellomorea aquimaris TaxID=189382 RepID=UPI0007D0946A|nr:HAD-IIB family hydrolase [Rossellomorea aquimaris]